MNNTCAFVPAAPMSKLSQYYNYVNNGGTMKIEEWEADGRYDPSAEPGFQAQECDATAAQ